VTNLWFLVRYCFMVVLQLNFHTYGHRLLCFFVCRQCGLQFSLSSENVDHRQSESTFFSSSHLMTRLGSMLPMMTSYRISVTKRMSLWMGTYLGTDLVKRPDNSCICLLKHTQNLELFSWIAQWLQVIWTSSFFIFHL